MEPLLEIKKRLEQIDELSDFVFHIPKEASLYASKFVDSREYRNENKDLVRTGGFYSLFVAHMYKGEERQFFYLTLCRHDEVRPYRHKYFHVVEADKIYVSGATVDLLINRFKEKLQQ